jgi:hypothetical protein
MTQFKRQKNSGLTQSLLAMPLEALAPQLAAVLLQK